MADIIVGIDLGTTNSLVAHVEDGTPVVLDGDGGPLVPSVVHYADDGAIVVGKVKEAAKLNYGYNAQGDEYEDLVVAGVIDPTKVTRTALQNAASIAGLLLTTECVVVEKKEKEKAPPMPGGGGGMGGMY